MVEFQKTKKSRLHRVNVLILKKYSLNPIVRFRKRLVWLLRRKKNPLNKTIPLTKYTVRKYVYNFRLLFFSRIKNPSVRLLNIVFYTAHRIIETEMSAVPGITASKAR